MKIRSILCPTDFSEFSRHAVEHAVALARSNDAELALIHVYPFMMVWGGDAPYLPSGLPMDSSTRALLLRDLEATAAPARAAGVRTNVLLLEGDPGEEILRQARTAATDLIVMGTHGRRGFDRWVLGSVARRVVQKACCPVLTVPRRSEGTQSPAVTAYSDILCPVDLEGSETTLDAALSMARLSGARVTVLHVLDGLPQLEATLRMAGIDGTTLPERLELDARKALRQAVARVVAQGANVDELVGIGKAYREILGFSRTRGVDLIVMGIHQRSPIDRLFLGSTTLHVLQQATCPVLTVPPQAEKRRARPLPSISQESFA